MGDASRSDETALPDDYFSRPSSARLWNYFQGGKQNYALDRACGDAIAACYPEMFFVAQQSRRFLNRAVRHVAGEGGVRQFLDLGCGLPVPGDMLNTHDVVQGVDLACRVVYVDNDPVVLAHARALLVSLVPGAGPIGYIDSDVRDIGRILAEAAGTLDLRQPVAVLMLGILGALSYGEALAVVASLKNALAPGSYFVHQDGTDTDPAKRKSVRARREHGASDYELRSPERIARYFDGMQLVEPGTVPITLWHPEPASAARAIANLGTVARKP